MTQVKKITLPSHQIRADFGSVNPQDRTVEVTWSTGSKGLRVDRNVGPFYEELSMEPVNVDMTRLNAGTAPVLANHDRNNLGSVIGVVEKAWLDKGAGKAILRFSESDPNADQTFKKIQERVLRNVSVGYKVNKYLDVSQKDDTYPTLRATRWEPQEISIVPIGFDVNAVTRNNETENEVEIETRSEDNTGENMNLKTQAILQDKAGEADGGGTVSTIDTEALKKEAAAQERTRILEINNAVRVAQLEDSVAKDLIDRGLSMENASKEIFKKLAEKSATTSITSANVSVSITRDEKETLKAGLVEYLANRMNSKVALTENGKRFYGMSLTRVCEEIMGGRKFMTDTELATRAMSTSDLPNILANVAEKSMRQEYAIQQPSFKSWTKEGHLRNYKSHNRLMLGDFPSLEKVNERGEFHSGSVGESKQSIKLNRYGKKISFTKEMIINDDLNALSDFSVKSARAASRLESKLVYTDTLLANPTMDDNVALFHANHGNLGSASAINAAALNSGFSAMRIQKSIDGLDYLDLMPKYLIVGPAKEMEAKQIVSTALLAQQISNVNVFAGRLEVVVDARITGLDWYLSADPSSIDTIELVRLEGEDGPMITVEKGASSVGSVDITCEHSAGAQAIDYRGLYKNPGA